MRKIKWFVRIAIALFAMLVLAIVVLLRSAPVSLPLPGMLANIFPRIFPAPRADVAVVRSRLQAPAGYGLSLFAADVKGARMLRVTEAGDVLVAAQDLGEVRLLAKDKDGDGRTDGQRTLLSGLKGPNGLDVHNGYLYVAETGRIVRVRFDASTGTISGKPETVIDGLPAGGMHWRKTIRFGPDGLLYLTIGSDCNVCIEEDTRRAAMLRYTPDGKFVDTFATGLRNSAGFDWRAEDGELYATDNGRDFLGDDLPPCELNQVRKGGFYGWPFAYGNRVPDPDMSAGHDESIRASIPPVFAFRPHNAPLGIAFLRSAAQPPEYHGAAVVALHGSWNRSVKDGYKVVSLHWQPDGTIVSRDFLTGFLAGNNVIGRPAEVAEDQDGNIYVSDDYAGAVYRVKPGGLSSTIEATSAAPVTTAPKPVISAADRAAGEALFASLGCPACHVASQATGDQTGKILIMGLAGRYSRDSLGVYLRQPRQPMPPVTAGDETVRSLANYLLATY